MFYNKSMNNGDFIDWDAEFSYPLQWLQESEWARDAYRALLFRTALAKEGLPSRNIYQEKMTSNVRRIENSEKRQKFLDMCACLPVGRSFVLANAVNNRAAQLAGGVDSYECELNDPYMVIDDKTEDLISAKCEQDYIESGVKYMVPEFSNDLTWSGVAAVLVSYNAETKKNRIFRINPKNIWFDTKYSALGQERFRGYSTMISWAKLRKMIEDDGDVVNLSLTAPDRTIITKDGKAFVKNADYAMQKIETLNGLDIYVKDLNQLAVSAQLQGSLDRRFDEYTHDLHQCYNLGWYKTYATDPEAKTKSGYNGDDVELTVIYDLCRKIEFKIINRRYVISKNEQAFRRKIPYEIINPFTQTIKITQQDFTLNCPLIFKFEQKNMDLKPYPQAPVFSILDEHDELCALIAKRKHVTDIISLLRIVANAGDAESLGDAMNIMGIILDDVQGDISTVSLVYDYAPLDSEIERISRSIKDYLKGYDEFDAMQAMGDRASATESGLATGAIAQGLSVLQQTMMGLYAEIARQCIGNYVTYSPSDNFRIWNGGDYSVLTIQQMATLAIVDAKPKLAKKAQERQLATNALGIIGNLGGTGLLSQDGIAYLMSQALFGQVPRGMAAKFVQKADVTPETVEANRLQGQNMATLLQQNQQAYEQNPIPYEVNDVMQSMSPDEVDQLITQYAAQSSQEPTISQKEVPVNTGENVVQASAPWIGSEMSGELANIPEM